MTDKHSKRSGGITRRFAIISLLLFFLGACTMPIQGSDQAQSFSAQIVAPSNGKTVALGTTLEVETRVSTPGVVTSVTLLVNGQAEREDRFSNPAFHSGITYQSWTPAAVGT